MANFIWNLALATMLASLLFTSFALIAKNDRGVRTGSIAYIFAALALQEVNPKTRSFNRSELENIDCQS